MKGDDELEDWRGAKRGSVDAARTEACAFVRVLACGCFVESLSSLCECECVCVCV